MTPYSVNGDPSMVWLGLGLLVFGLVAIAVMVRDAWKNRGKPKPPPPSERQNPPLPPRRRHPSDGGNQELHGSGPDAANNSGD